MLESKRLKIDYNLHSYTGWPVETLGKEDILKFSFLLARNLIEDNVTSEYHL